MNYILEPDLWYGEPKAICILILRRSTTQFYILLSMGIEFSIQMCFVCFGRTYMTKRCFKHTFFSLLNYGFRAIRFDCFFFVI